MTRTSPWSVVLCVVIGVTAGFALEWLLASRGVPILTPPLSLAITVTAAALIVVCLALPIQRSLRGRRGPVNPFHATRVVVLAKASSLCGGLILGFGAGVGVFLLTRPVLPPSGALWLALATAVSGLLLLVAGLVAEKMCTLPPDDPAEDLDAPT